MLWKSTCIFIIWLVPIQGKSLPDIYISSSSSSPTTTPTVSPTSSPTTTPTVSPTSSPTTTPTVSPTSSPTTTPTVSPTSSPTTTPTVSPTSSHTTTPSNLASLFPHWSSIPPDMYTSDVWTPEKVTKVAEKKEEQIESVKNEIDHYFDDVSQVESLCMKFTMDFDVNVCEMEGGWRKRNGRGFFFEEGTRGFTPKDKSYEWLYLVVKGLRESKENEERDLVGAKTCKIQPMVKPSTADVYFQKIIRLLVADNESFTRDDFRSAKQAITNFNYCTEDLIGFNLDTHSVSVDVSGMNWMEATYKVMVEAEKMGVDLHAEEIETQDSSHLYFNMNKYMTMVILPDDVDFEGAYGFAILHNGLSVMKASEAKETRSILHEIGHNLGMRHSSSPDGGEYGDDRCIMGAALDNNVCFNGHKSFYLGLYREFTTTIYPLLELCNSFLNVADVHDHLYNRRNVKEKLGEYYVVVQVSSGKSGTALYIMYYSDKDIIVGTEGSIAIIEDTDGESITFADSSQRVFDLAMEQDIIYDDVLYQRCESEFGARLLISSDLNATDAC